MATDQDTKQINLSEVIEEMFMVLTPKEKDVIVQRFSLDNHPKRTLESIGQQFSVTRERVRQIEKIALGKLRRTVQTTRLGVVSDLANKILTEHGGVLLETSLISEIINYLKTTENVEPSIIRLALNINQNIQKIEKNNVYNTFWVLKNVDNSVISSVVSAGIKILKKKSDVISGSKMVVQVRQVLTEKLAEYNDPFIISALEVDQRVKKVGDGFGLMSWRHINPRSIRDKAYIILKTAKKPMHFVEISNKISEAGFDKKVVTVQAVHNELIRYDQFVLVGRGLYGLKEFGYDKGTVADVIENLLKKKGAPMSKQEIIDGVLDQRHVKKGTISLNLQKNPQFVRVGRAVYTLEEKRKSKKA